MTNIAMERSTNAIKNGKPSISMGHGFHGYLIMMGTDDQRWNFGHPQHRNLMTG
jgi:hypothetical protein